MAGVRGFAHHRSRASTTDVEERMNRETVTRHLRAWADGADPSTGAALPPDHPGQRPDTLRVIFAALALLAAPSDAAGSRGDASRMSIAGPRNAGRPWSA